MADFFERTAQYVLDLFEIKRKKRWTPKGGAGTSTPGGPAPTPAPGSPVPAPTPTTPQPTPAPTPSGTPPAPPPPVAVPLATSNFTPDLLPGVRNPERGLAEWGDDPTLPVSTWWLANSYLPALRTAGWSLVRTQGMSLPNDGSDIPQEKLDALAAYLQAIEANGLKTIIRFGYDDIGRDPTQYAVDVPRAVMTRHIQQLGPVLTQGQHVILALEAGMVGMWGEWHHSTNYAIEGNSAPSSLGLLDHAKVAFVLQEWLSAFGGNILFRAIWPLREYYGNAQTTPYRLGIHNDAIFGVDWDQPDRDGIMGTEMGSFTDSESIQFVEYLAGRGSAPYGGEMPSGPRSNESRAWWPDELGDLMSYGRRFGMTYLSGVSKWPLFQPRIEEFEKGGTQKFVDAIGYRLSLRSATLPISAAAGQDVDITIVLRNDGFARPLHRQVWIKVWSSTNEYRIELPRADLIDCVPGSDSTIKATFKLPLDMPMGEYQVALWLPDKSPKLRDRSEYTIRPVNVDRGSMAWDTVRHAFNLGLRLIVQPQYAATNQLSLYGDPLQLFGYPIVLK